MFANIWLKSRSSHPWNLNNTFMNVNLTPVQERVQDRLKKKKRFTAQKKTAVREKFVQDGFIRLSKGGFRREVLKKCERYLHDSSRLLCTVHSN